MISGTPFSAPLEKTVLVGLDQFSSNVFTSEEVRFLLVLVLSITNERSYPL